MYIKRIDGPRVVALPDGTTISRADLPPINTRRWVAGRKAAVVRAVVAGLLTRTEAIQMYDLSEDEFQSWEDAISKHGIKALRATQLQRYRQP